MLITVRPIRCGNRNCIGLEGYVYGSYPPKLIVIEDVWDLPQETIEKAMAGLISHETIEWILAKWEAEGAIPFFLDLHDLIGKPSFEDYTRNVDGLPIIKEGEALKWLQKNEER